MVTRDEEAAAAAETFFRVHSPFDQMEPACRRFLVQHCRYVSFPDDSPILQPGDGRVEHLYIVTRGTVHGERTGTGEAFELGEGECFPMSALLGERATRTVYRARRGVGCYVLPRERFAELFTRSPVFRDFCIHGVSSLLEKVQRQIQASAAESLGGDSSLETPLSELMHVNPVTCGPETPLHEAVRHMHARKVGSIVVVDGDRRPVGIFTLHDLRKVVATTGADLAQPVHRVMTREPATMPEDAFAFEAVVEMARRRVRHLPVLRGDRVAGVVSERDLFALQRVNVVQIVRGIDRAGDLDDLVRARRGIQPLIDTMLAHGADTRHLTRMITLLNDRTVMRVVEFGLMARGDPGLSFTWIAFGSEGRSEQTLVTDQDNGILFEPAGESPAAVRERLLPLARWINEGLAVCGFPLCKGNIMASNPELCLSREEWHRAFRGLISQSTPENLLRSSIYFDLRPVWGARDPVERLRSEILEAASGHSIFLHMMAGNALASRPPLGFFRDFVTERMEGGQGETLDLKLGGLTPFVDGARLLSLEAGVAETNTLGRLERLAETGAVGRGEAEAWSRSFSFIQLLRMRLHQEQARRGEPLGNRLDPDALNPMDRRILREAFRQARDLQRKLEIRYQA